MPEKINFTKLFKIFQNNASMFPAIVDVLAEELGVSIDSINRLGVGFYPKYQAWTFAERDAKGNIIGIACRCTNGKKLMYPGSKHGLFYEVNNEQAEYKYNANEWIRIKDAGITCPVCGKPDWCMVSSDDPKNPSAVLCSRIASNTKCKILESGWLHILDPKRQNIRPNQTIISETKLPIIIVEGASDVCAAMSIGFMAIGRPSAEGGTKFLLQMPLHGKEVWVIGDNDAGAGYSGMQQAYATIRGITLKTTMFQPPEGIKDLRDWVQHGLTQEELIKYAEKHGKQDQDPNIFKSDDPIEIGERFLKEKFTVKGCPVLRKYKGQWVQWQGHAYKESPVDIVRGSVYKYLENKKFIRAGAKGDVQIIPYKTSRGRVSDILDVLNMVCPIEQDPPIWLDDKDHPDPANLIIFQNGILNIQEYIEGKITLHNPDPNLFAFHIFPYNYDENLESKLFKEFRNDIFETDSVRDQLLAQWFGYNTVPNMSLDTIMLFTGVPRSGKSTLLDVLGKMLGRDQCVSIDFRDLISPFGREPMLGKLAALLGDVKSPRPNDAEAALEMILRISGGDPVGVNRKMIRQLAQVYLKIRFTMAMNSLPVFTDHARAFQARLAIIGFDKSYVGKEDPSLKQQLIKEAGQGKMINFALQGLKDLQENGRFIIPKSSIPILKSITRISSPVTIFVDECCIIHSDKTVSKSMIFEAWQHWCVESGRKTGVKEQFGRWLTSTCPHLETERIR
ncbi:hypothetical protein KA005_02135, partial [bacterium]|nr:hypothetical protein [bacterium]